MNSKFIPDQKLVSKLLKENQMDAKFKKMKYPERQPDAHAYKEEATNYQAKTEHLDTDTLADELKFINHYLDCGHAKGRAHSRAAILNGKPGYFFVTSVQLRNGNRRECIMFATLVDNHIWLTNFS